MGTVNYRNDLMRIFFVIIVVMIIWLLLKFAAAQEPGSPGTVQVYSGSLSPIGGMGCVSADVKIPRATNRMAVVVTPEIYPGPNVIWHGYVSVAGTVTVQVCAGSVQATPSRYNVRVLQ